MSAVIICSHMQFIGCWALIRLSLAPSMAITIGHRQVIIQAGQVQEQQYRIAVKVAVITFIVSCNKGFVHMVSSLELYESILRTFHLCFSFCITAVLFLNSFVFPNAFEEKNSSHTQ